MARHSVPARPTMHPGVSRKRSTAEGPTPGRASAPAATKMPRLDQHADVSAAAASTPVQGRRQPLATLQLNQPTQLGPSRLQPKEPIKPRDGQVSATATSDLPAVTDTSSNAPAADQQPLESHPAAPAQMSHNSSRQPFPMGASIPMGKHSLPVARPKAASAEKPPQAPASAPPGRRRVVLEESDGDSE